MSCAAAAALLWLAASPPMAADAVSRTPAPAAGAVALEPLFADIVARAGQLKAEADAARKAGQTPPGDFADRIRQLADLDMQGHMLLKTRDTDGDLKCILKGISEDLPLKLAAMQAAATPAARGEALAELGYLLNDNVEVVTAPPRPPV